MPVPDFSKLQSQSESESQQEPAVANQSTWFKELRFWLSMLIGFILLICYKALFSELNIVIDVCVLVLVCLFMAIMAGSSIRQAIIAIIMNLLEIGSYH